MIYKQCLTCYQYFESECGNINSFCPDHQKEYESWLMFGISQERGAYNICYSKSIKEFIFIRSPSNRTDAEIIDTSFTLEQAYQIVLQLLRNKP